MASTAKSLKGVLKSFGVILGDLGRKSPLMFFVFIGIVGFSAYYLFDNDQDIVIFLTILISLSSFILYMYKDSYTEAFLTFFLGILTVFTIQWDHSKSTIFLVSYFFLNTIMFIGNSIKLASKVESILMRSATYTQFLADGIDRQYKFLRQVADLSTRFRQIAIIERAEIIDFLCFIRVSNAHLHEGVNQVETIKVLTHSDLGTSLALYKAVFSIARRLHSDGDEIEDSVQSHIENLLRLPLTVQEMIQLLNQTRKYLIQKRIGFGDYYTFVTNSLHHGLSVDELVIDLQKLYDKKNS